MHRYTVDYQFVPQWVARGARNFRDNRDLIAGEAVEQTRLADVRLTDQYTSRAIAQNPALLRCAQNFAEFRAQLCQPFECVAPFNKVDLIVWKIQRRFRQRPQFDQGADETTDARRELARQRTHRSARRGL